MKPYHAPIGLAAVLVTSFAFLAPAAPCPPCASPIPISSLPFVITAPGSYCVTQDLVGSPGQHGIIVQSDRVEIDLGGFRLLGDGGASAIAGIADDVTVRNGRIEDWDAFGIELGAKLVAEDLEIQGTGAAAISADEMARVERCNVLGGHVELAFGAVVRDSTFEPNFAQEPALSVGDGSTVEHVRVSSPRIGLLVGPRSNVKSCKVNGAIELAIAGGAYSCVEDCIVTGAGQNVRDCVGIEVGEFGRAVGCAVSNAQFGIKVRSRALVSGARIERVQVGIEAEDGVRVDSCNLDDCVQLGIGGAGGVSVRDTTITRCGQGLALGSRGTVEGCTLLANTGDGILLGDECIARNNMSTGNAGAGLRANGKRNRIEGNTLDSNNQGLFIAGVDNLATDNRAAANTASDFTIPLHNPAGPLLGTTWWIQGSNPQANFKTPFP